MKRTNKAKQADDRIKVISGATAKTCAWKAVVQYGGENTKQIQVEVSSLSVLFANLRKAEKNEAESIAYSLS